MEHLRLNTLFFSSINMLPLQSHQVVPVCFLLYLSLLLSSEVSWQLQKTNSLLETILHEKNYQLISPFTCILSFNLILKFPVDTFH